MQEQERIANEEAEKRLKATLTAKREPGATASRVASPAVGNSATSESADPKPSSIDEVESSMDVDLAPPPPKDDVCSLNYPFFALFTNFFQSVWLPELVALFEDVRKIAPADAYDVIG